MIEKKSPQEIVFDVLNHVFLGVLGIVMLYPMLYELFVSVSVPARLTAHRGVLLLPLGFDLTAYAAVLNNGLILSGYLNTIFIIAVGLTFNLTLTCSGAYFLTRKNVLLRKPILIFMVLTMYFYGGLIPFFLTVRNLGLYDSLWALIFPTAVTTYNMILLRSYFMSIPESIYESVSIDGGGHLTVLFRFYVPLSLPAMAVMVLYYGVGHWNSWFNAMIFLRSQEKFPLQLVLREMLILGTNLDLKTVIDYTQIEKSVKAAVIIVSTLPILLVYPFLQKYFVGGLMIGSIKE